jgi:glycosyltransferase involved in cell wall biosynthesis
MRPKLLQLGQTSIDNPLSGGQLRNYHIAHQLAKVMDVSHLGFRDEAERVTARDGGTPVRMKYVQKERSYTFGKLLRGALGKTPATLLNFRSAAMNAALAEELETGRYDIVQLEGIEMSPYLDMIRASRHRPEYIVLDWHNIESELAARHAVHGRTPLHRLYMRHAVGQLRTIERELLDHCDLHLVTSRREREVFLQSSATANIMVLENGVDSTYFASASGSDNDPSPGSGRDRLLFIGSMDYSANIDAVMYFVEEAWPAIQRDFPALRFTVVGRNPPASIRALAVRAGLEVTGTVADVRPYYQEAFAAVVPLRVGGGTRLKVLEAMAAGVPVVSTTVGVEGLRLEPGVHFSVADSPAAFHRAIDELRGGSRSWRQLAAAGRKLAAETYDWQNVCAELIATYCRLLKIEGAFPGTRRADVRLTEDAGRA